MVQFGKFSRGENNVILRVERNVAPVIMLHYAWIDMTSGHIGRCVEMGYESDDREVFFRAVPGKGGHQIAVFIK